MVVVGELHWVWGMGMVYGSLPQQHSTHRRLRQPVNSLRIVRDPDVALGTTVVSGPTEAPSLPLAL